MYWATTERVSVSNSNRIPSLNGSHAVPAPETGVGRIAKRARSTVFGPPKSNCIHWYGRSFVCAMVVSLPSVKLGQSYVASNVVDSDPVDGTSFVSPDQSSIDAKCTRMLVWPPPATVQPDRSPDTDALRSHVLNPLPQRTVVCPRRADDAHG